MGVVETEEDEEVEDGVEVSHVLALVCVRLGGYECGFGEYSE